nr:reverse transcriptase domain-containing protein [Tanacetum cinerariifolium]
PATVKAVEESCVTCGGAHSYRICPATDGNVYRDNIQEFISQASAVNYNQRNTSYHPLMMSNQIRPLGFPPVPNNQNVQLNQRNNQNCFNQNQNRGNNFNQGLVYQPLVFQPPAYQALAPQTQAYQALAPQTQGVLKEDFSAYIKANDAVMRNIQTQGQNMQNQLTNLTDLLTKFVNSNSASTSSSGTLPSNTIANPRSDLKAITTQSEAKKDTVNPTNNGSTEDVQPPMVQTETPLNEMARTPLNEHCLAVLLKKLPEKLGDPGKFLIPCDFPRLDECLALADLDASINLIPLSMWKILSLLELTPTCMTLELVDRSISRLIGVAEDVYVKVRKFHFLADFVVVDFDADPRVPLILGIYFLKTGRALIDVFEGELTLRVGKEAIIFNLDQTSRYLANYNDMTAKRINVIDMDSEEYSQEVLDFSNVIASGSPIPYDDPIVSTTSSTLTPFGNNDFLLEEVDAFLALDDDLTSPKVDQCYLDPEGDILLLEAFLNDDPSPPPPNKKDYLPEVCKELKIYKAKSYKSSIDEPPEVELKDLPPHLKYAFLEDQEKTTFTFPYEMFAYRRMPFGLCKAPGTFQRCMMAIFHDMIEKTMEVFMDDFLVFENSFQSCLSHLERMLKRWEDTNLCLNWENSHFMVKEGIVLGHKISKQGIEVDKAKADDPSSKDTPFIFSKECVETFQTLKRKLTEAPILIAPDSDMPFKLMCDASDFAIGAVLGQRQDKHFRPIHYASKTMTEAESNYTTTEKEMLDMMYAFEKFWSYLLMNKSIVYTDHSALKYLFAKKDSKARLLR